MCSNSVLSPLQSWQLALSVEGPLALTQITQHFCHNQECPIELVYQFPLPADAVLQQISVVINEQRLTGQVKTRGAATARYEEGVEKGQRSILIEEVEEGFYQLCIANVVKGDNIELELTVANLLHYQAGRWCYRLPTVLGIKYGERPDLALPQHQSLFADYGLYFQATLPKVHDLQSNLSLSLASESQGLWQGEGKLDQPLWLSWQSEVVPQQRLVAAADEGYPAAAVGLIYPEPAVEIESQHACLQMVVDCSGSMQGLPINQAKQGLLTALADFTADDRLNLIKFGTQHETLATCAMPYHGHFAEQLQNELLTLAANLGGTELYHALRQAQRCAETSGGGDILLCTDGDVWEEARLLELTTELNQQGIRLFTIGIGNSSSEPLLKRLAQATGGNSLMVNPQSNMADDLALLIKQLRAPRQGCVIEPTQWQLMPMSVFAGHSSAFYQSADKLPTRLSVTFTNEKGEAVTSLCPTHTVSGELTTVVRKLVAQQQVRQCDYHEAEVIAVRYQLLSKHSSFVLIDEEIATDDFAATVVVPNMIADGHLVCAMSAPEVRICSSPLQNEIPESFGYPFSSHYLIRPLLPDWAYELLEAVSELNNEEDWSAYVLDPEWLIEHGCPVLLIQDLQQSGAPLPKAYAALILHLSDYSDGYFDTDITLRKKLHQLSYRMHRRSAKMLTIYAKHNLDF